MTTSLAALAAHLGWTSPTHLDGCAATGWDVDYRQDSTARDRYDTGHTCADEDCRHGDTFRRLQVRIVCRTCGAATLLTAEEPRDHQLRTTAQLGFGTAPRQVAGLWVYTGPPPSLGLLSDTPGEPAWHLVAQRATDRLEPGDVLGCAWPATGPRGGSAFRAAAELATLGTPSWEKPASWAFARHADRHFPTLSAAVSWIGTASKVTAR